jgi:hypothetical protein
VNNADEASYRRFTLPEERKDRTSTSNEWRGSYRWFASPSIVKLEDYRLPGETVRALERLRCRKLNEARAAVASILSEARRQK